MADNILLKQLYSELSDDQLTYKLLHQSHELTDEAIAIGKEEMANRNISFEKLELAQAFESVQKKNYEQFKLNNREDAIAQLLKDVINAKIEGKEDTDLITTFEKQGIATNITLSLLTDAKQQCKDKIEQTRGDLFYGIIITVAGVAIAIVANKFSGGTVVFLPYGAIFYGLFKFLRGLGNLATQKKLKEIIKRF